MKWRSRRQRLVDRLAPCKPCPVCPGHARLRFYSVKEGDPGPPPRGPCPACGKVPEGVTSVVFVNSRNPLDEEAAP